MNSMPTSIIIPQIIERRTLEAIDCTLSDPDAEWRLCRAIAAHLEKLTYTDMCRAINAGGNIWSREGFNGFVEYLAAIIKRGEIRSFEALIQRLPRELLDYFCRSPKSPLCVERDGQPVAVSSLEPGRAIELPPVAPLDTTPAPPMIDQPWRRPWELRK